MTDETEFQLDKKRVRLSFNRAASTYDEAAVLQKEVGQRLLERVLLMRHKPKHILDLGAGTGTITQKLNKQHRFAQVTALDIAEQMLNLARDKDPWIGKPRYVCGDLENLPFAGHSADAIFSNLSLQWCNDPIRVFTEFKRVLAPGGMLLFSTFGPDTLRELRECWSGTDNKVHVNGFIDMHNLGDTMLHAGLAEPVLDRETFTLTYKTVRSLMDDLKHLGAHNSTQGRPRGLTGKTRIQSVVDAYETLRQDGVLPATYEIVYGHAWSAETPPHKKQADGSVVVPIDSLHRQP